MYELIPLVETWLEKEGFTVSVLANRVDGTKKTGFLSSENVTLFLEDSPDFCSVKIQGSLDVCQRLGNYLLQLPPKEIQHRGEKEIIIKEREIVSVPCQYCHTLVPLTDKRCPNCGAYIRG